MRIKFILFGILTLFIFVSILTMGIGTAKADGVIYWNGNGKEWLPCYTNTHWNLIPGDGVTGATIYVNGVAWPMSQHGGGAWEAYAQPLPLEPLPLVYVEYTGEGNPNLHVVLSHCVAGDPSPTPTNTATATPTETFTSTPTNTSTFTPSPTSTFTATSTNTSTPTDTATNTPTSTYTASPTGTYVTPTPSDTATPTKTSTVTLTATPTITPTATLTSTPTPIIPTETPKPPIPDISVGEENYPGVFMGTMYTNSTSYEIYSGVKGNNGSLLLPTKAKGGALYNNQLWIHRVWNTGWFKLSEGDNISIELTDGTIVKYKVIKSTVEPYGKYFDTRNLVIVSCYGANGTWEGVEVYTLKLIKIVGNKS